MIAVVPLGNVPSLIERAAVEGKLFVLNCLLRRQNEGSVAFMEGLVSKACKYKNFKVLNYLLKLPNVPMSQDAYHLLYRSRPKHVSYWKHL